MEHALAQHSRIGVLSMDSGDAVEVAKVAGALASGALGLKLFDWLSSRWNQKKKQSGEWQIRILDDGEKMREDAAAEAKALRVESSVHLERAHRAELDNVSLRNENLTLRARLARKDEQGKALIAQLMQLGATPVTFSPGWDSGAYPVDPADRQQHGDNGKEPQRRA